MIRLSLLAALTLAALAGTSRADTYHAYATAQQRPHDRLDEHRSAAVTPAPRPRGDYGSFSAANTAHTLGY